jgi:erythromycin esterase
MPRPLARLTTLIVACGMLAPARAQDPLNLDFEARADDPALPDGWAIGASGSEARLDGADRVSGEASLRFERGRGRDGFAVATAAIPVEVARGKTIRLSGAIKTEGVEGGYAGLWIRVDGPGGAMLGFDNMAVRVEGGETVPDDRGVRGTSEWRGYAIEVAAPPGATNINFGCLLSGAGVARFDDLRLTIGGTPFAELAEAAESAAAPTPGQLDWLRAHAVPFETDRAGSGFDDLRTLKPMIGDARIVALGEATHGTAEFFRMKHRLTEYLASELGFTVFAIEASMPEAARLNDYVLRGEGDPEELLRGLYFWTWDTREVLDMILWMRELNASGRGRIEFLGFDMQEPRVAAANVRASVAKAEPGYSSELARAYAGLETLDLAADGGEDAAALRELIAALERVRDHLAEERDRLVEALGAEEADWAIQNARIVAQAVTVRRAGPEYRDRCMAENVDWILAQRPPGTRAVLWAHNGHVARRPGAMGGFLAGRHGDDYLAAGFAFHEGSYTAIARGQGLRSNAARPSRPGSVEWAFHRAGLPRAVLDLRAARGGEGEAGWLARPMEHRNIGALAVGSGFFAQELPAAYDLLIFFDHTTPSQLLPPRRPD